jgi:hypothetical protein
LSDAYGIHPTIPLGDAQIFLKNPITPLDFLLYLGKRGMGALEYEPKASVTPF